MATIQIVVTDDEKESLSRDAGNESLSNYFRRLAGLPTHSRGRTLKRGAEGNQVGRAVGATQTEHQGTTVGFSQPNTTVSGQISTFNDATPRLQGQVVRLDVDYDPKYRQ